MLSENIVFLDYVLLIELSSVPESFLILCFGIILCWRYAAETHVERDFVHWNANIFSWQTYLVLLIPEGNRPSECPCL